MKLFKFRDKVVSDIRGGTVKGAMVEVLQGNSLATLYNESGAVISNPLKSGKNGVVEFYVSEGVYDVKYRSHLLKGRVQTQEFIADDHTTQAPSRIDSEGYTPIGLGYPYEDIFDAFLDGVTKFKLMNDWVWDVSPATNSEALVIDPVAKTITISGGEGVGDWTGNISASGILTLFETAGLGNEIGADQIDCVVEIVDVTPLVLTYGRVIGNIRANTENNNISVYNSLPIWKDRPVYFTAKDEDTGIVLDDCSYLLRGTTVDYTEDRQETIAVAGAVLPNIQPSASNYIITNHILPDGENVTDFTIDTDLQAGEYISLTATDGSIIVGIIEEIAADKITFDRYLPLKYSATIPLIRFLPQNVLVGEEGYNFNNMKMQGLDGGEYPADTNRMVYMFKKFSKVKNIDCRWGYDSYGYGVLFEDCSHETILGGGRFGYFGNSAIYRRCTFSNTQDRAFDYSAVFEDCYFDCDFPSLNISSPSSVGVTQIFKNCRYKGAPPHFGRIEGVNILQGDAVGLESAYFDYALQVPTGLLVIENGLITHLTSL